MKTVGFALVVLFSVPLAMAKSPESLIKSLNRLNAKPISPSINQCSDDPEYTKTVKNEKDTLLQTCAIELCGKPSEAVTGTLQDNTFEQYVEAGVIERFPEIENEIVELAKHTVEGNKKFIADLRGKLQNGKLDFKFNEWKPDQYSGFFSTVYGEHVDILINTKLPFEKRIKLKAIYPANASATFKKSLDSYIATKQKILMTDVKEGLYEGLYTKDESKQLFQTAWDKFYANYQEQLKTKPDLLKYHKNELDELIEDSKNPTGDPYDTANSLTMIDYLSRAIVHENTGAYPPEPVLETCVACQPGVQEFLSNIDLTAKLNELEAANTDPKLISDKLLTCKSNLASKGMKASDAEAFLKLAPEIKKRFLKLGTKGFSAHSLSAFEEYLNESLHLSFELAKEEGQPVQEFIDGIHASYKAIQPANKPANANANTIPNLFPGFNLPDFSESPEAMVKNLLDFNQYGIGVDAFNKSTFCDSDMSSTIWDAFYPQKHVTPEAGADMDPEKDNIQVSKFSCTHHSHGKGVFAHEMGHAMSFAFHEGKLSQESLVEFKKLRACANGHHKQPSEFSPYPDLTHEGDTLRTEEDTADLLSYMTFPDDEVIFECALLSTNAESTLYTQLSLDNPYKNDTHSAPLFRALQEAVHKGRTLPLSCAKIIQETTKYGFEKCF